MRLQKLYIEDYKNIHGQSFDLTSHEGLTLLIGNNGSGKSNVIEVISDIFSNLYQNQAKFQTNNFEIEYVNDDIVYNVKYTGTLECKVNNSTTNISNINLPRKIITIYSGETSRLWEIYYKPIYDNVVTKQIHNFGVSGALRLPEMIYLNHFYWDLSLMTLLCSDAEDIKEFCQHEIGIIGDVYFHFEYAQQNGIKEYHKYKPSRILEFVKSFDSKTSYTKDEYVQCINNNGFDSSELFELLYCAYTPKNGKIITHINVTFNSNLTTNDLSEGLKKRILIRAALEFAGHENSLYLLDEPDAHIHLNKKKQIIEDMIPYKATKHIIMTSHSPTICKHVGKTNFNSVILLDEGEIKPINNIFEVGKLMSDDQQIFNLLFTTKHLIITEGKTDCLYIKKAVDLFRHDYPVLYNNADYISVGGTDGEVVKELLSRITDISNRKIIVLVDRDGGGLKCARNILSNEQLKKEDIDIRAIAIKTNAYLVMIPNKNGGSKEFTIEDYFGHDLLEKLSIEYIQHEFSGKNFVEFPRVKDDLKKKILPNFCNNSNDTSDFIEFKVLLNKLETFLTT